MNNQPLSTVFYDENLESDADSSDQELDHPLSLAEVFTAKDVVSMTKCSLERLRDLYQREQERLEYLFQRDRWGVGGRSGLAPSCVAGDSSVCDALRRYARPRRRWRTADPACPGRQRQRRPSASALAASLVPEVRQALQLPDCCSFADLLASPPTKCRLPTLPMSKYCFQHITCDSRQVLFERCGHHVLADCFEQTPASSAATTSGGSGEQALYCSRTCLPLVAMTTLKQCAPSPYLCPLHYPLIATRLPPLDRRLLSNASLPDVADIKSEP